jgi:hypothetical protein
MSATSRILPEDRALTDSAASSRLRVEPAPGQAFAYDARDTVAKALLGQRNADRLWSVAIRGGFLKRNAPVVMHLAAGAVGFTAIFNPAFSSWGIVSISCALSLPNTSLHYLFCNVRLLRESLLSFDAFFLTAQIIIMCVGEAGSLGWGEHTLFFFCVVFPSYFTVVVSDACHHRLRSGVIFLFFLALMFCGVLLAVLLVNSLHTERIEVTVLNLWAFSYPVRCALMTHPCVQSLSKS